MLRIRFTSDVAKVAKLLTRKGSWKLLQERESLSVKLQAHRLVYGKGSEEVFPRADIQRTAKQCQLASNSR